jgi:hypothetical protein
MRNARHLIAVTMVATALCADRMTVAAPSQPQVTQIAGRLVNRLTGQLRRSVVAGRLYQPMQRNLPAAEPVATVPVQNIPACQARLSPFYFRLPPPQA